MMRYLISFWVGHFNNINEFIESIMQTYQNMSLYHGKFHIKCTLKYVTFHFKTYCNNSDTYVQSNVKVEVMKILYFIFRYILGNMNIHFCISFVS